MARLFGSKNQEGLSFPIYLSSESFYTVPSFLIVQELEKEGAKAIATQSEEPVRYELDEEALCECPSYEIS